MAAKAVMAEKVVTAAKAAMAATVALEVMAAPAVAAVMAEMGAMAVISPLFWMTRDSEARSSCRAWAAKPVTAEDRVKAEQVALEATAAKEAMVRQAEEVWMGRKGVAVVPAHGVAPT